MAGGSFLDIAKAFEASLDPPLPDRIEVPLDPEEQAVIWCQTLFLHAFQRNGTISAALRNVEVPTSEDRPNLGPTIARKDVTGWLKKDIYGFKDRFDWAKETFADRLEDLAIDLVRQLEAKNNCYLLITMLRAHRPEKYNEKALNISIQEEAQDIWASLKQRHKADQAAATEEDTKQASEERPPGEERRDSLSDIASRLLSNQDEA